MNEILIIIAVLSVIAFILRNKSTLIASYDESPDHQLRNYDSETWKHIVYSKSMPKSVVLTNKELESILTNTAFLVNPTDYGKEARLGEMIGLLNGTRIYKSRGIK